MKVLWICHFSNSQIRKKLHFSVNLFENFVNFFLYKKISKRSDFAAWITNGISEFEKIKEVELHIISPHYEMKYKTEEFELGGIHYHFFKPDDNFFLKRGLKKIFNTSDNEFNGNRKIVKRLVNKIKPDLIHMFGAENPYYSITALDIDTTKIPFQVTLQTLLSDAEFLSKSSLPLSQYNLRAKLERKILGRINYIGSSVTKYRDIVWENINPSALFFDSGLAVAENVKQSEVDKAYDFVYFSVSIEKAVDVAIEAFAIACEKLPFLTLNIIGESTPSFTQQLTKRISELGIEKNITFSGKLSTHEEVLLQIQKSKYALLPLKIDHISGTIREAMFSEIPVLTTRTHGTPSLNENRESVLISEQGDYEAMAQNMFRLIESPELTKKLKENGLITVHELWNNKKMMTDQVKVYQSIFDHHHFNKPISAESGTSNPKLNETR